jgi:hypothetical protein
MLRRWTKDSIIFKPRPRHAKFGKDAFESFKELYLAQPQLTIDEIIFRMYEKDHRLVATYVIGIAELLL